MSLLTTLMRNKSRSLLTCIRCQESVHYLFDVEAFRHKRLHLRELIVSLLSVLLAYRYLSSENLTWYGSFRPGFHVYVKESDIKLNHELPLLGHYREIQIVCLAFR